MVSEGQNERTARVHTVRATARYCTSYTEAIHSKLGYVSPMVRRSTHEPLQPSPRPRWLVVRDMHGTGARVPAACADERSPRRVREGDGVASRCGLAIRGIHIFPGDGILPSRRGTPLSSRSRARTRRGPHRHGGTTFRTFGDNGWQPSARRRYAAMKLAPMFCIRIPTCARITTASPHFSAECRP